jgi:ketosteroid isomerase-like protein
MTALRPETGSGTGTRPADAELTNRATAALHRYCRAIDEHDAAALGSVFSEDAVLLVDMAVDGTPEGGVQTHTFEGRDAVVPILASLFEQRDWARHQISNALVEVDPAGEVTVRCYVSFLLVAGASRTQGVGDYTASLRDGDGSLLVTRLRVRILDEIVSDR